MAPVATSALALAGVALSAFPGAGAEMLLKVMGQSGKFMFYDSSESESSGITVTMDALKEVDSQGNEVGKSGSVKHSINSFASQSFTIEAKESGVDIGTATADRVNFTSSVGSNTETVGQLMVETYLMTENGTVGTDTESWDVDVGDLKWNIAFPEWKFCDPCGSGNKAETGAFLDLTITISGKGSSASKGSGKVEIGGGAVLNLAQSVTIDEASVAMPSGYPKVEAQGSKTMITFRFPKFKTSALYDPTITGASGAAAAATTTAMAATTTASSTSGAPCSAPWAVALLLPLMGLLGSA